MRRAHPSSLAWVSRELPPSLKLRRTAVALAEAGRRDRLGRQRNTFRRDGESAGARVASGPAIATLSTAGLPKYSSLVVRAKPRWGGWRMPSGSQDRFTNDTPT